MISGIQALDLIRSRRSIRQFKPGAQIPEWQIEAIMEAARWGPSPENRQFWRIIKVQDQESKKFIADLAQEAAQIVFGHDKYQIASGRLWYLPQQRRPEILEYTADGSLFRYPEQAHTVFIICYSEAGVDTLEHVHSPGIGPITSTAMAIQNMWLTATAFGLGMGYNALPVGDERRRSQLEEYFGIPRGVRILTTLSLGVPAQPRIAGPSRFPLESIAFEEYWGNPYLRLIFRK